MSAEKNIMMEKILHHIEVEKQYCKKSGSSPAIFIQKGQIYMGLITPICKEDPTILFCSFSSKVSQSLIDVYQQLDPRAVYTLTDAIITTNNNGHAFLALEKDNALDVLGIDQVPAMITFLKANPELLIELNTKKK